jgi:hypothetical protein
MLARLDFKLIHDLLHVRNVLGKAFSFPLLRGSFHSALQDQRSVLCGTPNTLIVQVSMRFDGSFEVILDRAI